LEKNSENTGKKRKKGALKSRISILRIVTYPQGVTVFFREFIKLNQAKMNYADIRGVKLFLAD